MTDEPLFASVHGALTFAFNYSPEQYAPSVLAKLAGSGGLGSGKGLIGVDGAGQAGMILAEVMRLGNEREATYVAQWAPLFLAGRYAPHALPCSCRQLCCSGVRPAPSWYDAVANIAAFARELPAAEKANYRLRHGLVRRFFGARVNMTELAKESRVSRDVASRTYSELLRWLKHEEGRAQHAIVVSLKEKGFVA